MTTAEIDKLRSRINWKKYPKLAETFEHRPSVNVYWQEFAELLRALLAS